jgi:serine/threonine protein kinase
MGAVYEARQLAMDRTVALKLIRPEIARQPGAAARFYREMQITARIAHHNTIHVYDFGELDGQLFLAMELLRGRSLRQALKCDGPFSLERLIHVCTQILRALAAAHSEHVVHRDLKPDNVMLVDRYGEQDTVKVLDFGIAKLLEQDAAPMTHAGSIIGTPAYMSPEQAQGQTVDTRADLYSLGVMLFELASGRLPFDRRSAPALVVAHALEPAPPLAAYVANIHPALAQLTAELLEKDPDKRPPTARTVEARLLAIGRERRWQRWALHWQARASSIHASRRAVLTLCAALAVLAIVSVLGWRIGMTPQSSLASSPRSHVEIVAPSRSRTATASTESSDVGRELELKPVAGPDLAPPPQAPSGERTDSPVRAHDGDGHVIGPAPATTRPRTQHPARHEPAPPAPAAQQPARDLWNDRN